MSTDNVIIVRRFVSPCGTLLMGSADDRLCLCDWLSGRPRDHVYRRLQRGLNAEFAEGSSAVIDLAVSQLDEFFVGKRRTFNVPLLLVGTEFQKKVWRTLHSIPYGHTISYGELANRLCLPRAVRAVANATGVNALSVFVPCHRVIGSDSSLTGYAGGLDIKRCLLELESNR